MNKPEVTLFMLQSIDGKISTGVDDNFDFDRDLSRLGGIKDGLQQYYDLEKETSLWSMNSGAVMAKVGCNNKPNIGKMDVNFVILDNTHLTINGVKHFINRSNKFVLVTRNKEHPAYSLKDKADNMHILEYDKELSFSWLFHRLYKDFKCYELTTQTGGTINTLMLREGVIDRISLVIAPIAVGGVMTPSLFGGESINNLNDLCTLELESIEQLKNSYVHLVYKVVCTKIADNRNIYDATSLF